MKSKGYCHVTCSLQVNLETFNEIKLTFRHINSFSQLISCSSRQDLQERLRKVYQVYRAGIKVEVNKQSFELDYKSGSKITDQTRERFSIEMHQYGISFSSLEPATIRWHLNFSDLKVTFPNSECLCKVYHTQTPDGIRRRSNTIGKIRIMRLPNDEDFKMIRFYGWQEVDDYYYLTIEQWKCDLERFVLVNNCEPVLLDILRLSSRGMSWGVWVSSTLRGLSNVAGIRGYGWAKTQENKCFQFPTTLSGHSAPPDLLESTGGVFDNTLSSRGMSWGVWVSSNLQLANTSMEYNPLYDNGDGFSSILLLLYLVQ
ncbi:hypothetical protein Tco_0733907, partial [Tanacetum coccineum]